ncbi:MAG: hypothetical protein RLZZ413_636, partial [Pseudomonadota bacterium]
MLTRRHLLATATAALALPLAPRRMWAATTLTLGAMQIDSLSDGSLM